MRATILHPPLIDDRHHLNFRDTNENFTNTNPTESARRCYSDIDPRKTYDLAQLIHIAQHKELSAPHDYNE